MIALRTEKGVEKKQARVGIVGPSVFISKSTSD